MKIELDVKAGQLRVQVREHKVFLGKSYCDLVVAIEERLPGGATTINQSVVIGLVDANRAADLEPVLKQLESVVDTIKEAIRIEKEGEVKSEPQAET